MMKSGAGKASGSAAIKRIQRELVEIQQDQNTQQSECLYWTRPLDENLFEWHFTLKGPPETDYQGGLYHGIILLPPEYPFRPPWVIFKTPNGRFELNRKICLSITAYHPEEWNPSWGIRTVLLAIISHFPTEDKSSIGYLEYSSEERKALAKASRSFCCPVCGPIAAFDNDLSVVKAQEEQEQDALCALKSQEPMNASQSNGKRQEKSIYSIAILIFVVLALILAYFFSE